MIRAPRLYLVTDRHRTRGRPLAEVVAAAVRGGVDTVQLREKDLGARQRMELGTTLVALCHDAGVRLLVNDRVDVALAIGAHGVHLPGNSFQVGEARQLLGNDRIVGVSTHSLDEARKAAEAGADFVVFGPIYDTPSKRMFGQPQGIEALREVVARTPCPVIAIGGITPAHIPEIRDAGASGIAVIGALLESGDPAAAAQAMIGRL